MDKSEQINELATALAKAQAEIKNPQRNREVKVQIRTGGSYTFKYATLDAILDCVRVPLTKNGLWFTQTVETIETRLSLVTTLLHSSGQWTRSTMPLNGTGTNQELGSELTYKRRYSITGLLGIAADEDDDGNHADGNIVKQSRGESGQVASLKHDWKVTSALLPDVAAPSTPPTPAQAALQPVAPAPAMLNAQADALAAQYGRDVKSVRKECKQMLKSKYPGVEIKDMTVEEATKACDYLCAAFLDAESAAAKEQV